MSNGTINFECPHCGELLRIPEQHRGQEGKCKMCEGRIVVPGGDAAPTAPKPAATRTTRRLPGPLSLIQEHPLGALAIMLAVLLALMAIPAMVVGASGTPLGLALFSLYFTIGTAFLISFIVGLVDARIVSRWWRVDLAWWHIIVIFAPAAAVAYFLSWLLYSP